MSDHIIDRPDERGVESGSARESSLKGRDRAIVNQTKVGTVSKAINAVETSERRDGTLAGFSE